MIVRPMFTRIRQNYAHETPDELYFIVEYRLSMRRSLKIQIEDDVIEEMTALFNAQVHV